MKLTRNVLSYESFFLHVMTSLATCCYRDVCEAEDEAATARKTVVRTNENALQVHQDLRLIQSRVNLVLVHFFGAIKIFFVLEPL